MDEDVLTGDHEGQIGEEDQGDEKDEGVLMEEDGVKEENRLEIPKDGVPHAHLSRQSIK